VSPQGIPRARVEPYCKSNHQCPILGGAAKITCCTTVIQD
jgi:hypothetical protein